MLGSTSVNKSAVSRTLLENSSKLERHQCSPGMNRNRGCVLQSRVVVRGYSGKPIGVDPSQPQSVAALVNRIPILRSSAAQRVIAVAGAPVSYPSRRGTQPRCCCADARLVYQGSRGRQPCAGRLNRVAVAAYAEAVAAYAGSH